VDLDTVGGVSQEQVPPLDPDGSHLSLLEKRQGPPLHTLRALLIAPPGAGKGTQGERLAELYGVPHISAGAVLRRQVANASPSGATIAGKLGRGELIPDELVLSVMCEELSRTDQGFILDGFPRTLTQAIAAEQRSLFARRPLDAAIELDVPEGELVARLARRRAIDPSRQDDTRDVIAFRLELYRQHSVELLSYYRRRGILLTIDGTGAVDQVTERIRRRVDGIRHVPGVRLIEG
jgi:adenylate kinase